MKENGESNGQEYAKWVCIIRGCTGMDIGPSIPNSSDRTSVGGSYRRGPQFPDSQVLIVLQNGQFAGLD